MSLLSDIQGAPERIYSLARLLGAHGGRLARSEVFLWLDPQFDQPREARAQKPNTAVEQTLRAAASLDCVSSEAGTIELKWKDGIETFEAFCDRVHDRLLSIGKDDPDYVLFDVYAWLVRRWEADQTVLDQDPEAIANLTNADRGQNVDGDLRFNSTKYPPWRRWMIALGLGVDVPEAPRARFMAYASERLERELFRADLKRGVEIPASEFLQVIALRMPYLDGGQIFEGSSTSVKGGLKGRVLSRILSRALLDLHDEGVVHLDRRADARNLVRLAADNAKIEVFETITLRDVTP
jgi:hypothetical protein